MGKRTWTVEQEEYLKELYVQALPAKDIQQLMSEKFNRSYSIQGLYAKAYAMGLTSAIVKPNNPKFKAIYQDYNWCYERYINRGMTMQEMAEEAGASLRVIKKWCQEIYDLDHRSYKKHKTLTDVQRQIIMFGILGDGHIDKRENQPLYIESHAENQKDYIYWKWSILKDLCHQGPVYYPSTMASFGTNKQYLCQPTYRLCTRIIDELKEIRQMNRIDIINKINKLGLSLHMLDDGFRDRSNWELCLAEYSQLEIDTYLKICKDRFGLVGIQQKDKRYISFNAPSSRKIDGIILENIPNDLDIVQYKIIDKIHYVKNEDII